MKETNSERTIKECCERSCGNIGKMITLRALFRCLSYNGKKVPAQRAKNYGHQELGGGGGGDFGSSKFLNKFFIFMTFSHSSPTA